MTYVLRRYLPSTQPARVNIRHIRQFNTASRQY